MATEIDPLAFQKGFAATQSIFDNARQNRLAQMAFDQKQQEIQQQNALAGVVGNVANYDAAGNLKREVLPQIAAASPGAVPQYQRMFSEQATQQAAQQKAQRDQLMAQFDWADKNMAGVQNQAQWDEFRARAAQVYPDVAARLPAQFDPAAIQANRMKVIPIIDQWKAENAAALQNQRLGQDQRQFDARQQQQESQFVRSQATTQRGQDMANQRQVEAGQVARDAKTQEQLDKKVNSFSTQLDKTNIPQFESLLSDIEGDIARLQKGDIPGFGPVAGNLPQFLLSREGQLLRQKIATLQNMTLKDRSGAAVTNQELNRLLNELGTGVLSTDDQLRSGLTNVRRNLDAVKRNVIAGVDDATLNEYQSRGGLQLQRGATRQAQQPGSPQRVASKAQFDALPSGTLFVAPDGTTRRKP